MLTFGPDSTRPDSYTDWRGEVQKVRTTLLEPIFWKLHDPIDVLELLFRDDYPFDWYAGQVILRIALIAGLQTICGLPAMEIVERISVHKSIIEGYNSFGRKFDEIMRDFFEVRL